MIQCPNEIESKLIKSFLQSIKVGAWKRILVLIQMYGNPLFCRNVGNANILGDNLPVESTVWEQQFSLVISHPRSQASSRTDGRFVWQPHVLQTCCSRRYFLYQSSPHHLWHGRQEAWSHSQDPIHFDTQSHCHRTSWTKTTWLLGVSDSWLWVVSLTSPGCPCLGRSSSAPDAVGSRCAVSA